MIHISAQAPSIGPFKQQQHYAYSPYTEYDYPHHGQYQASFPGSAHVDYSDGSRSQDWFNAPSYTQERYFTQPVRSIGAESLVYGQPYGDPRPIPSSVSSLSAYTPRYDTPRSASETSTFSPPAMPVDHMFMSPETYHAVPSALLHNTSAPESQDFEHNAFEPTFDVTRSVCNPPQHNSLPTPHQSDCEASYLSDSAGPELRSQDGDSDYVDKPVARSRRNAGRVATRAKSDRRRVNKLSVPSRSTSGRARASAKASTGNNVQERPFHCPLAPYGCKSTFASKNEWKRHFRTQHMRLGFWRCDQCPSIQGRKSNDFNRKDLFMQHVRRMHSHQKQSPARKNKGKQGKLDDEDREATEAAERCHKQVRSPPVRSICVICGENFHGATSWDKRMEHMGKHFEDIRQGNVSDHGALDVEAWRIDEHTQEYMVQQGILRATDDGTLIVAEDYKE